MPSQKKRTGQNSLGHWHVNSLLHVSTTLSLKLLSYYSGLQAMKRFDWVCVELTWLDVGIAIQSKKHVELWSKSGRVEAGDWPR